VLIGLLYSAAVHSLPMNSDGATVVLEGKAMSGGNLLLNHWGLSPTHSGWSTSPFMPSLFSLPGFTRS
jgi:hypothetical protein